MHLNHLKYLLAIESTGNLSAAAEKLGVSQPALSKFLTKLQNQERLELFYRESNRIRPTQAGRLYLDAARKILMLYQDALSAMNQLHNETKTTIRLGITPHQGAQFAAKVYPLMRQRFPGTELQFCEGYTRALYDMVANGAADFGLTTVLSDASGVSILPLFEEEVLVSVPVSYGSRFQATDDPQTTGTIDLIQLKDAPFVLMDGTTTIGALSKKLIEEAGFAPTVVFSSSNGYAVDEMIRAGMGVGIIPMHYAVPSGDVLYLRLREKRTFKYCVIYPEKHELTREERYLTYLQLKLRERDASISYIWNDTVLSLIEEFEVLDDYPLIGGF